MTTKMGFEGQAFYGAAGATGSTQLENARDISYDLDTEDGDTTSRGDGSALSRVYKLRSLVWR